jgi:hypothetical protein
MIPRSRIEAHDARSIAVIRHEKVSQLSSAAPFPER